MSLYVKRKVPFELFDIDLSNANKELLLQISSELGIGLNLIEMEKVRSYFLRKGRRPTDVELQTIGQTWSEHCFHKTFKGDIIMDGGRISNLLETYIAKATRDLRPTWCLSVFEDNAGIVEFDNGYAIAAKVETHNHPSAIEPFGGAATGIGGVIRDVLGVWAEPVACMNVLGFGPLDYDYNRLPLGTKHPNYIFRGVVSGIGCYGNNMGIPTVNGAIYFDESYIGNVVVYCGCIGILPIQKFVKDTKPGDVALLAGGRTGRDGIHGVTFASSELTEKSEVVSKPAVQIANPIEEEKLKRAIIEVRDQNLGSAITDLGGGGLSCAVGEMAHRFNCGAHIELEKVPLKNPNLAPWEIYVSESQERMLMSVPEKNLQEVLKIFEIEEVGATPIGRFTDDAVLKVDYKEYRVAELNVSFLFQPPKRSKVAKWKWPKGKEPCFSEPEDLEKEVLDLLSSPNLASKESVIRTYDHEVKGNTVLKPLHGEQAGPSDAAVIKPLKNSWKGIVISCGMNPKYGKMDPYWMAASNIDEAIRNNTAVGGRRIALLDNFTWGNPEKPDRLAGLVRACQACYEFSKNFETPFISGKDSLYNESTMGPVTPTLLITALGILPDIRKAVSVDVKVPGDLIYLLGRSYPELGGSEYYRLRGFGGGTVPKVRALQARKTISSLVEAIDEGYIKASHDVSEGGLAVAAAEMAFSGGYGIELHLSSVPRLNRVKRNDSILFSESNSRFLLEIPERYQNDFEALVKHNICAAVGRIKKRPYLRIYGLKGEEILDSNLEELLSCWKRRF